MASTAAPSAPSLSPRPIQRLAAMAAASVVRTRSRARLRSGACRGPPSRMTIVGRPMRHGRALPGQRRYLGPWTGSSSSPSGPLSGTVRAGGAKNSALKLMAACLLAEGRSVLSQRPRIADVEIMAEVLRALGARRRAPGGGEVRGHDAAPASWYRRRPTSSSSGCAPRSSSSGSLLARCGAGAHADAGRRRLRRRARSTSTSTGSTAMGAEFVTAHGEVRGERRRTAGWSGPASCSSTRATPRPTTC